MVKSHASRFVPRSKRSMLAQARIRVSCTRSSARSRLLVREMAKARRLGTAASIWSRSVFSTAMLGGLLLGPDLVDELGQWRRQGLEERVGIDGPQSHTDPVMRFGLHVMPEAIAAPSMRNNDN